MTTRALLECDRVRQLVDTMIDRSRELLPDVKLTVLIGAEAANALIPDHRLPETTPAATRPGQETSVVVLPTLPYWLVMVVPAVSALMSGDPVTSYGDLRTNTFATELPRRF